MIFVENISAEELHELTVYEPLTGEFRARIRLGCKTPAGKLLGTQQRQGYVVFKLRYVSFYAHRLAWLYMTGSHPEGYIDHIDLNKANNRMSNLRLASMLENSRNRNIPSNNKTGKKGVMWDKKANKYRATIKIQDQSLYLGLFDDLEDAANAYDAASSEHFGEFARTNTSLINR